MSFIHYMMGRGLRQAVENSAGGALANRLVDCRRSRTLAGKDHAATRAFHAELRGDLPLAHDLYADSIATDPAQGWVLARAACVAAVLGDWPHAADYSRQLAAAGRVHDTLVLGEVHLLAGNPAAALEEYQSALLGILGPGRDAAPANRFASPTDGLDARLDAAAALLRQGLYVRARQTLEETMAEVDLLLGAHAGAIAAEARVEGKAPNTAALAPLVKLSDILLRFLVRASLASNLADALRKRQLRDDLALWATGSSEIASVLQAERARLSAMVQARPNHAELQYRLGLLCRATGDLPAAAGAFRQTLAVQAGYTRSVARLGVTLDELGRPDDAARVIFTAFDAPAATLGQYYTLALATTDPHRFDRTVAGLAQSTSGHDEHDVRANLAMALAELGLLDETRREWKDVPAPSAA